MFFLANYQVTTGVLSAILFEDQENQNCIASHRSHIQSYYSFSHTGLCMSSS